MRLGHFLGWLKPVAPPEPESRPKGLPPRPDQRAVPRYRTRIEVFDSDGHLLSAFTGEGRLEQHLNRMDGDSVIRAALDTTVRDYNELA